MNADNSRNVCRFCGKEDYEPHKKYTDRCVECGKRYTKYSNYKSLQKTRPTFKRAKLLLDIVEEYENLKLQGYRVPRDLQ